MRKALRGKGPLPPPPNPVPFIYFKNWVSSMDVIGVEFYPNYRSRMIVKKYGGKGLITYLREFNPLTSTIYRPNPVDTSFLLFTDDVFLPRPVYGGINALYALGNMALGVFKLPFDKGQGLRKGLWGVIYSFPELFWSNIRKGSFLVPVGPEQILYERH